MTAEIAADMRGDGDSDKPAGTAGYDAARRRILNLTERSP